MIREIESPREYRESRSGLAVNQPKTVEPSGLQGLEPFSTTDSNVIYANRLERTSLQSV